MSCSDIGIYISISGENREESAKKILPVLQEVSKLKPGTCGLLEPGCSSVQTGNVGDEIRIIATEIDENLLIDDDWTISDAIFKKMAHAAPDATWKASAERVIDFGNLQDLSKAKAEFANGKLTFRRRTDIE